MRPATTITIAVLLLALLGATATQFLLASGDDDALEVSVLDPAPVEGPAGSRQAVLVLVATSDVPGEALALTWSASPQEGVEVEPREGTVTVAADDTTADIELSVVVPEGGGGLTVALQAPEGVDVEVVDAEAAVTLTPAG